MNDRRLSFGLWYDFRNPAKWRQNDTELYEKCFAQIARAEQLEREARVDVARGLVGEALALDLRWASGPLRFELERRRDALRREA